MMVSFQLTSPRFGGAILLVWLVTWASGRCRLEASWIDRSGRLLGAAWVGTSLLSFSGAFAH